MVNQASLTGESIPVPKRPGASVYAGTVMEEGECVIRVTRQSGSSRYDHIVTMIEQSERLKSAAENKAASLADKLVPYTLLGSAAGISADAQRRPGAVRTDGGLLLRAEALHAAGRAVRHAASAARCHVTVKGGKYLEAVAKADTIVFDKTGTLTYASPVVR